MEELSLSYNGGKDCLVLLMLILACLPRHFDPQPSPSAPSAADPSSSTPSLTPNGLSTHAHSHAHSQPPPNTPLSATPRATTPTAEHQQQQQQQPFPATLQSVYIVSQHPFAEVDEFVAGSARTYHLDLRRYPGLPMRAALEAYLAERPALKAVFVGTRRTDPHGADLRHFDPTDEGWPRFVRVHPVIDWHYAEIWAVSDGAVLLACLLAFVESRGGGESRAAGAPADKDCTQFIRHLNIPYLSLYDKGYTSLGGTEDTHPNPHLKKDDGHDSFRPAYELIADDEERLGRDQ